MKRTAYLLLSLLQVLVTGLEPSSLCLLNRRDALQSAALIAGAASSTWSLAANAAADDEKLPVLVLGASGKTGRECINYLLHQGRPCIATTRTGSYDYRGPTGNDSSSLLTVSAADVTNPDSLQSAIGKQKLQGVIYAASASKKGGTAAAVDRDGVIAAAQACLASQVPRYVVVSSGAVTQPDSAIYKLLNSFGRIMEAKIQGENEVRRLYADESVLKQKLGYTIIRPGGLTQEAALGASALELNQGDMISGRLPRADVAALCVEAISSPDAFDVTFECYEAVTAKPLEAVGLSNILKSEDPTIVKTGKERRGETYAAMFKGLVWDPFITPVVV